MVDGEMSRFMCWVGGTHTMRYHAHYHTSGMGHVYFDVAHFSAAKPQRATL
jgi:hypothetical protein